MVQGGSGDGDVIVVGAGVSGLTTAVLLAEQGLRVNVVTADPPERTLSVAAGAIWGPYLASHPRWVEWSTDALERFRALSRQPGTGVEMVAGIEAALTDVAPPEWGARLPEFAMCARDELPAPRRTGWRFVAPVVNMPTYLGFLANRLVGLGGTLKLARVGSLTDLAARAPLVVNCTGIGARSLVPDPHVEAVRGELVVVANPGISEFFMEYEDEPPHLTYYVPQGDTVVLGGTAEHGREHLTPDPGTAEAIIERCAAIEPRLAGARILQRRVGIRPTTPIVRLERDGDGIIHNYGHGGSGVTLSWGCAADVVRLAMAGAVTESRAASTPYP